MKLSDIEKKELEDLYQKFYHDEKIQRMKNIPMHRGSNCFLHSFRVVKLAIKNGLRHKYVDLKTMLIASVMHDYYLYDWRTDKSKKKHHVKNHPLIAIENASKDFEISDEVKAIVKTHMWPMNFKDFPKSKEARIVGMADTIIATKEALVSKKYKSKRLDKYYRRIEKLF